MTPAKLSININKYALLRNSRGHNVPNLADAIDICLDAGAHGITIHPRRDQRHIRFDDVAIISEYMALKHPNIELNIECELHPFFIDMALEFRPAQCTLVPVTPGEITSDHGWDIPRYGRILAPAIAKLKSAGVRTSIFMDCKAELMAGAAEIGTDRVEFYTGPYAWSWGTTEQESQLKHLKDAAAAAAELNIGVNAGHDLDRHNLAGIATIPDVMEVSIGHAHVCRALEVGQRTSIHELLTALGWN